MADKTVLVEPSSTTESDILVFENWVETYAGGEPDPDPEPLTLIDGGGPGDEPTLILDGGGPGDPTTTTIDGGTPDE